MGGVKNPFGGGNIGSTSQIKNVLPVVNPALIGTPGSAIASGVAGIDTSIKDPAGMQQYTDLANQAQAEYGKQRQFMSENVDPQRKSLLAALADQASGKAPSVAEAQLKSAFDTGLKNQLALARSNRGANAGLASRNVSNIAAQQTQNLAQQGAIAKMQERQAAQGALANQLATEQNYGVNTLGAALGSQANVAAMQNAQRDKNDARNKGILGGVMQLGSSILGMAEGGQVQYLAKGGNVKSKKDFYNQLKACGGKVQNKADGGYVFDKPEVGIVPEPEKKEEKKSGPDIASIAKLAALALAEGGQAEEPKVEKVSEMDEEAQKIFKEHGSLALQKHLANKKMRQNMYNLPEQDYKKAEGGLFNPDKSFSPGERILNMMNDAELNIKYNKKQKSDSASEKDSLQKDITHLHLNKVKRQYDEKPMSEKKAEGGVMMKAGGVPGQAEHAGDNYANDKVPAMLSPGEVVVPRSVIADGPKAAAHFVEQASKDKNYNAETYAQERPSFIKALRSQKQKESDYESFKKLIKR